MTKKTIAVKAGILWFDDLVARWLNDLVDR
jgi:hypothetical protein